MFFLLQIWISVRRIFKPVLYGMCVNKTELQPTLAVSMSWTVRHLPRGQRSPLLHLSCTSHLWFVIVEFVNFYLTLCGSNGALTVANCLRHLCWLRWVSGNGSSLTIFWQLCQYFIKFLNSKVVISRIVNY